ncbi:EamA family transporter RarD [Viridibacillus sp. FSL R5-0477]|uniref:Protein rarD n=1 Tax=Viridibacillus arenosi FSL R5-213 TaxID=1227360 RepID=W4EPV2_9BACL|nr:MULTISPECIES: EamA family transporter RarD [Viridibacillus]ETT82615.1 protein rarD [Viridibacillus arenosi FSL R5-213]OMC87149.1 EamA family transporter [Viridibacillus sp. FSL H7-0596]OMC92308.1 EamA family transporter [Viridibacillus arenosi]
MQEEKKGILSALGAYIIWGIFPLYWKGLQHVASEEVLAGRVIWSFILTLLFVVIMKQGKTLLLDFKQLWQQPKSFWLLVTAAYLISLNWFLYIWAVNNNHIVESSLGYYMNPLVSVLLGIFFLKEKLSKAQVLSFIIAAIGVLILVISYGQIPWLSFGLALTFGVYGLLKKKVLVDATRGLVLETFFILPVAVAYYVYVYFHGNISFLHTDLKTDVLIIGTGIVTAVPLILFATGAQKIPLYLVGFIQYVSPTIMLFLGVIVYGESFSGIDLLSFSFIWVALILFSITKIIEVRKSKN